MATQRKIVSPTPSPRHVWGVTVTNMIQGLPINAKMQYAGTFFDLLSPYTVLGGVAFFLVFTFHGALYLTLKTEGYMIERARKAAVRVGILTAVACLALVKMTYTNTDLFASSGAGMTLWGAVAVFVCGYGAVFARWYGLGFICSSLTVVLTTIAFFWGLFPRLMVSSLSSAWDLTIMNSASSPYTLTIMTFAAAVMIPIILLL